MHPLAGVLSTYGLGLSDVRVIREYSVEKLYEPSLGDFIKKMIAKLARQCRDAIAQQNIGDIQAQIAANETGANALLKIVDHFGLSVVQAYMKHVQTNAKNAVHQALTRFKNGDFSYAMDSGARICVKIKIDQRRRTAVIDFTGTSKQLLSNFNAPRAVCRAAILYVFRTLVKEPIPMNEGCMKPLKLIIPDDSMLNPSYPAAVVAGNVETSQYIVDALYGALGVMAASQGTMNNFTFENERYQYYETICGGSGAGLNFHGFDAVHTHMTNSHLTDTEVLELQYPILVKSFSIRDGSGGLGKWFGGNGVIRHIQFLESMTVTILSSHRFVHPYGMAGGQPGALGENWLIESNGQQIKLPGTVVVHVKPNDSVMIKTPGGGGYGIV